MLLTLQYVFEIVISNLKQYSLSTYVGRLNNTQNVSTYFENMMWGNDWDYLGNLKIMFAKPQ